MALVVADVALTLHNTRQLHHDAAWVAHTHEVLTELANVLSLAKDAETGQRGFVITGKQRYLEPYISARGAALQAVDNLQRLTADNPIQQAFLPELRKRLVARLQILEETMTVRKNEGLEAARVAISTDRGKNEMDALRRVVGEMVGHEQQLLRIRSEKSVHTYRMAVVTGLLAGISAIAAFVAFMLLLRRHLAARTATAFVIAEQAERLRTTLASIGDGVITTDIAGGVSNLNAVAESLTGWTNGEATGQPLETVFRIVNETTRRTVENPATRALRDGVIVGLANHTVLIAKDGSERAIDDSAAPIRCKEGEIVG